MGYGQTGTGKTFSLVGEAGRPGIAPRAAEALFKNAVRRSTHQTVTVTVSALEVYNERVLDLLAPGAAAQGGSGLRVLGSASSGVDPVEGLSRMVVSDAASLMRTLGAAFRARATDAHLLNSRSSRSHLVVRIACQASSAPVMASSAPASSAGSLLEVAQGVLTLVDLAGSERVHRTGAEGDSLKEAQAINKSLSALGDVVAAFGARAKHIPFRNSTLTQVLRDALSGEARVIMLATASPDQSDFAETSSTLRFAQRCGATSLGAPARAAIA
jgi:kinesin family protein C2/C3